MNRPRPERPVAARFEVREMVTCARCGTMAAELPLTWSSSAERGGTVYYCDTCSRENVRAIEGRLDEQWWA